MKPQLPTEIQEKLPHEIVDYIMKFVPHSPKPKKTSPTLTAGSCSLSPALEKDLRRIQTQFLKGKTPDYMRDLDDFVLD